MNTRGQITDKWHRVCVGCGSKHHINALRRMDGNECCPGRLFTRDRARVEGDVPREDAGREGR